MRLKRLELYGYKSFASRTVFEFGEGVTAVVGPNGCGKSNIADAMRWVMGEQSYRSLRAQTTEDMIFAGSRKRARLGMAEVIITLDNSDGWLPIDYTEVTIGRRAHRSGENEYLLNGQRVRYRDLLDLLGSGGLGRSAYTVIGQGMVDAALALRPEARRALFEEAAGIAPHLRKREESLTRIEETERNLERVSDILNEIRSRAGSLRRQAERAEEYLLLTHDLQELQRIWYGFRWQQSSHRIQQAAERLKQEEERLQAQRVYVQGLQDKRVQVEQAQARQRLVIEKLLERQAALREESTRLQRELAVAAERRRLFRQQRESLVAELQSLASRRDILQQEIERTTRDLAEQEALYTAGRTELESARADLDSLNSSRRDVEKQSAAEQQRLNHLTTTLSDHRARAEQAGERIRGLVAEQEEARAALADLEERLKALEAQGDKLAEQESALAQSQAELQQRQAGTEAEITATRDGLEQAEEAAAGLRAERNRLVNRYETLGRLRQELGGYYPGVREVLNPRAGLSGLLGTVANLMQVPAELEEAIESALGPRLQNIVAERWENAEAAIDHLKRTRSGWATFLPLDTLRTRRPVRLSSGAGVVGVASALVRFEERLRPVYELLLGSVVVVDDLACARRLLGERTGASLFVTLGGETVQPTGAVSGGTRQQTSNLLQQEREWRDLPEQIKAAEDNLAEALQAYAAEQARLSELRTSLKELERQFGKLRLDREAAHRAVNQHAQEVRDLQREQKWRQTRLDQASTEVEQQRQRESSLKAKLGELGQQQLEITARLSELQEQLGAINDEGLRQRAAELETRVAVAERTVHSQRTLLSSHRNSLAQVEQQLVDKQTQDGQLEASLQELAADETRAGGQLAELEKRLKEFDEQVQPARQKVRDLEREERDIERQHNQAMERLREAELGFNRTILDRDRCKEDQTALAREIGNELGPIDLPEIFSHQLRLNLGDDVVELPMVETLPPGLEEEIRQLRARMRRMGQVNPDAPREYEQLLDRQTFLQGQAADLRGAIASLREVIDELDTLIERDLMQTFRTVNTVFGQYFQKLFNGGSAQLILTDPENISTTGVDIIAHPPGKRPQNLALLSGGERSLTAVALMFALLQANPVPFCFLDEVDAALDEANVGRFRDLLLETARSTQFVVITHNRNTIESALTIYGISMGEQGISQCISMKLEDVRDQAIAS